MDEFMELYSQVYKDLYKIAYYYMGNREEAEDAVSEAVLRAYENFHSLRKKESFRKWAIQILVNCCKGQQKKQSIQQKISMKKAEEEKLWIEPDYITALAVHEAMEILTEEERLIVVLHIVGGYKGKEISEILQKNHNTIRSKYKRALEKLKLQLEM